MAPKAQTSRVPVSAPFLRVISSAYLSLDKDLCRVAEYSDACLGSGILL